MFIYLKCRQTVNIFPLHISPWFEMGEKGFLSCLQAKRKPPHLFIPSVKFMLRTFRPKRSSHDKIVSFFKALFQKRPTWILTCIEFGLKHFGWAFFNKQEKLANLAFLTLINDVFSVSVCSKANLFFCLFSGALPFVTASVFCFNSYLKWLTIISYSILCIWGLHKALIASGSSPWQRRLCFALPFLMRVVLMILRLMRIGGGNPNAMV